MRNKLMRLITHAPLLALLMTCLLFPVNAVAGDELTNFLAGKRFKRITIDDIDHDIVWFCTDGSYRAVERTVNYQGAWSVKYNYGDVYLVFFTNGELDFFIFNGVRKQGEIIVVDGRKWYHVGSSGC